MCKIMATYHIPLETLMGYSMGRVRALVAMIPYLDDPSGLVKQPSRTQSFTSKQEVKQWLLQQWRK